MTQSSKRAQSVWDHDHPVRKLLAAHLSRRAVNVICNNLQKEIEGGLTREQDIKKAVAEIFNSGRRMYHCGKVTKAELCAWAAPYVAPQERKMKDTD